jgi:transaldolase/glucose-6-phosphate isomerase
MKKNPLRELKALGQSVWLDFFRRALILSGELKKLAQEDGLRGVTSNPSIFEKAIAGSHEYDGDIRALALESHSVEEIYEALVVRDIQMAADTLRPFYDELKGQDGFVSLEVSPHLAHDTEATIAEARRLWNAVKRPNVMIKVPATLEGLPAIRQLTNEGINVNITLLFGLPRYERVADAYLSGLEERATRGEPIAGVASVASFFLSRIDVLLDPVLEKMARGQGPQASRAQALVGQVAIASAKIAFQIYKGIFSSPRFQRLDDLGAKPQRLLWASTSTKNPAYPELKYVEPLIGAGTINTMPVETLNAYRDHGKPSLTLEQGTIEARATLEELAGLGIDLDAATRTLENEGVEKFNKPYDILMSLLRQRRVAAQQEPLNRQALSLGSYEKAVCDRLARLENEDFCARFWRKDPGVYTSKPETQKGICQSMGWLHVAEKMEANTGELSRLAAEARSAGFEHAVLLGMGGSSLAPLVMAQVFPKAQGGLPLIVLDSTDPESILGVERGLALERTLFIVSSKSGTTAESSALGDYFFAKVQERKGDRAGENFIAITDPGTPLEALSRERRYRRTVLSFPDIGGRYSAFSPFGLIPAALMGVEVGEALIRELRMARACDSCVPLRENPGVALGAALGELALRGRDKLTFFMPRAIEPFGLWLEQLVAESTGKNGKGLVPIAGEELGAAAVYGNDRVFVFFRLKAEKEEAAERLADQLRTAGHPVVSIEMDGPLDLAQEMFRWEMATATAGSVLGINPFDQPNVQESKDETNRTLTRLRISGKIEEPPPSTTVDSIALYARGRARDASHLIQSMVARASPGTYLAIQAYLPENGETRRALQALRTGLRDALGVATMLDYGPRYLHSTGQMHKGGPEKVLVLQLTRDPAEDVPIPKQPYGFGELERAQAIGDLEVLRRHERPAMRVHLAGDPVEGLDRLLNLFKEAVADTRR